MDEIENIEYWRKNFIVYKCSGLCDNVGFESDFLRWAFFNMKLLIYGKINVVVALVLRPEVFLNQIDVKHLIDQQ